MSKEAVPPDNLPVGGMAENMHAPFNFPDRMKRLRKYSPADDPRPYPPVLRGLPPTHPDVKAEIERRAAEFELWRGSTATTSSESKKTVKRKRRNQIEGSAESSAATENKDANTLEAANSIRESQEAVATFSQTQQDLLSMEQSAAFYALQFGKDDPVAQDFEEARLKLEDKMRGELFEDWAKRTGYVGSPKKAEYLAADAKLSKNAKEAKSDEGKQIQEVVTHAPFADEDLQRLLAESPREEGSSAQDSIVQLEDTFNPLIIQTNESGDNIVVLNGAEVQAKRKKEKPAKPKVTKVLRDAFTEEDARLQEEERGEKKKNETTKMEVPEVSQTPEQKRAEELRKEIARLVVEAPEMVASDIIRLQKELDLLENGPQKKHSGWGWLKERAKGFATFGFWEVHQAERLRSSTKEVAKDVGVRTQEIQKTTHLSLEDALEEAAKIQFAIESAGRRSKAGKNTAENIERLSNAITGEKIVENNRVIDETVRQAESELIRRLEKYKNEFGERVITDEKAVADTMNRLRAELQTLQDGQRETDVREIKTVLRSLDPKYWRRYVYGGVEAAVWIGGGYMAWSKLAAEKAIATGVKVIQPTLPGDMNMHNTIWQSSKELLINHGVSNPTNAEVLELAKPVAELNGIGVKAWHLLGHPMDTMMQQGYLLKVPKVALQTILRARGITP